jgi:hypothetical protein
MTEKDDELSFTRATELALSLEVAVRDGSGRGLTAGAAEPVYAVGAAAAPAPALSPLPGQPCGR